MDSNQEDLVAQFTAITGANPNLAQSALQSTNWNLDQAVSLFYSTNEADDGASQIHDDEVEERRTVHSSRPSQPATAQSSSSGPSRRTQGGRPKQMTLDELKKMQEDDEDSDDDRRQNMFAGGEKSGLAVQNPSQESSPNHFRNILNQARQNRERPAADDEEGARQQPQRTNHFTGRAQTLGGDDVESRVIEDPLAGVSNRGQSLPRVTRTLHLWADGISIDEGPLFRFDDPANQNMMTEINRGRAPLSLLDVQPGQEVDLNLVPHKDENYVAPKKAYKPFSGQGQRLGSPTPRPPSATGTRSAAATSGAPASSSSPPSAIVKVDESAPIVQIQIRLGDGTRLQARFNTTHTIGDVYGFVDNAAAGSSSAQRQYALMTTFPSKELNDRSVVLGDLSEFKRGGVMVQKFT